MNTKFINSKNSKTSDSNRFLLNLADKIALINIFLYQILACTIHRKYEKSHMRTINLKYQLQQQYEEFELPDGSYSISDIQGYFEYI